MRWKGAVTGILVAALCAGMIFAQGSQLIFRTATGQNLNLADEKGKVVVLAFSATWAPLASKELPALQRVADQYAGRSVSVYWVSINTAKQGARNYASDADLTAFATRYGLKVPVLRDSEQSAYHTLGVTALPTVVVLDSTGRVVLSHIGFDPDQAEPFAEVTKTVDKLLR